VDYREAEKVSKYPRPKSCDEPNCEPILPVFHEPDETLSQFCMGVRTGPIKGKEKALADSPDDVVCQCLLIGTHSEAHGRHCFVMNIEDFLLQLRSTLSGLHELGLLERVLEGVFQSVPRPGVETAIRDLIHRREVESAGPYFVVGPGVKIQKFYCSCGQEFFRKWYKSGETISYVPTAGDEIFFNVHRRLGHQVFMMMSTAAEAHDGHSHPEGTKYWDDETPVLLVEAR
jgi:hypothetical protein